MPTDAERRVLTGETWNDFCDALKAAGAVVLREGVPKDAFERAEGFRYLARLLRTSLEQFVEHADPLAPEFRRPSHETVKIGADNPDNYYQAAPLSGAHEYVIRGKRNTVHYLGIGTYAGNYGSSGRSGQTGYIDDAKLEVDPDGRFEIRLSCAPQPKNWLPMEPDTSTVIVRQTFENRAKERIADLTIERVGGRRPAPLTPEFLDRGLQQAAAYVRGTANLFEDWTESFAPRPNQLPRFDPKAAAAAHGDPNIVYYHGYWELADDEALVIEVTPPACDYWNFQVNNWWMESLDYRYHRIALNHAEAKREADGSVRVILAHRDPGHPNWLETAGHRRGTMCWRWIGAKEHPTPQTRVVKRG
jgi:hypothetical protein